MPKNVFEDPNAFQCKQFVVHHHLSTFKVNTDSILLGSWADLTHADTVLDLGTGSGLLALMAAQKVPHADILGIEIHSLSANQAKYNVDQSSFIDRIRIEEGDMFAYAYHQTFDAILCNPPYFSDSTLPKNRFLQVAKHTSETFFQELWQLLDSVLSPKGTAYLVLPLRLMNSDFGSLYPKRICTLHTDNTQAPYAFLVALCKDSIETNTNTSLCIYTTERKKTPQYLDLVAPFLL